MNTLLQKPHWLFFLLGFLLYANTLSFDYALDDKIVILNNSFTKQGVEGINELVTNDSMVGFFGRKKNLVSGGRYRPLALVTHALEWEFFGRTPWISHLMNALLYALTCLLIYLVLHELFKPEHPWWNLPFLATLLYTVHPIHTEVVANIKSRDELLSIMFAFLAFWMALQYARKQKSIWLLGVFIAFGLSLFSKESSVTFVVLIPLAFYFFTAFKPKEIGVVTLPLVLVTALYLVVRQAIIGDFQAPIANELMNNPFLNATNAQKYATIAFTLLLYLKLLFFPHPLTHDYYPKQIPLMEFTDVAVLASILVHVGLVVVMVMGFKKRSLVSFALLWYFGSIALYSNVLFPIGTFMNDRFLYVASLGFALLVAKAILILPDYFKVVSSRGMLQKGLLLIICVAFSLKTVSRNFAWKNDETLALTDVKISTNSAKVNMSAGLALIEKAKLEANQNEKIRLLNQAITYLKKSLAIYPTYIQPMVLMGNAYSEAGEYEAAFQFYGNCFAINPGFDHAFQNLEYTADIATEEGKYQLAAQGYELFLEYKPNTPRVLGKLGEVYGKHLGDITKAQNVLERAYELEKQDTNILQKLGVVYAMQGKLKQALSIFLQAYEVDPENARVLMNIGLTYTNMGQVEKGNEFLSRAFELEPELKNGG